MVGTNPARNYEDDCIFYKICIFIENEDIRQALNGTKLEDYERIQGWVQNNVFWAFEHNATKFLVSKHYDAPFFRPVYPNVIFFTSLESIYDRLWLLVYGDGGNRINRFWPRLYVSMFEVRG